MEYSKSVMENCKGRYRVEWYLPCLVEMGLDPEMRIQAFDRFAEAVNKFMRLKALGIYQIRMFDRTGESVWLFSPNPDPLSRYESKE